MGKRKQHHESTNRRYVPRACASREVVGAMGSFINRCTIWDLLESVDPKTGQAKKKLKEGDSFYVWSEKHASEDNFALLVFEKDFSVDSQGVPYVVDGLDVIIL